MRGIKFGFKDKISPRAGFAWDVRGDGKWKGYGSFGIFYDTSKLEMPRGLFGSEHSVTYYMTLDTFNWPAIQCGHPPVPGPTCPGTFIEQVDFRHAANEADNFLIDPTLKPIRTREFTLGLDHELNPTARGRRPLRAQALRSDDRRHRRAGARHRRGVSHHQSRRAASARTCCATSPAAPPARTSRSRPATTTASSSGFAKRFSNSWQLTSDVSLQPVVRQLLGPDQLGREQPQLAEREPVLRRPVLLVRSAAASRCSGCCRPIARTSSRSKASTTLPWGTGVGLYWLAESGTPLQTQMREKGIPFYPFGRGDLGPHGGVLRAPTCSCSTTSGCSAVTASTSG